MKTVTSFSNMHTDHQQWQKEHQTWRNEIDHWRKGHTAVLSVLAELQDAIRRHEEALANHVQEIEQIALGLDEHEQSMHAYECQGTGLEQQEPMTKSHQLQEDRQIYQRNVHERIKRHHHTVMTQLAMLKAALDTSL